MATDMKGWPIIFRQKSCAGSARSCFPVKACQSMSLKCCVPPLNLSSWYTSSDWERLLCLIRPGQAGPENWGWFWVAWSARRLWKHETDWDVALGCILILWKDFAIFGNQLTTIALTGCFFSSPEVHASTSGLRTMARSSFLPLLLVAALFVVPAFVPCSAPRSVPNTAAASAAAGLLPLLVVQPAMAEETKGWRVLAP